MMAAMITVMISTRPKYNSAMAAASARTLIARRLPRSAMESEAITLSITIIRLTVEEKPIPVKGRILALDLGRKRIGLALSDPLGITAQGLPTLERTNLREDIAALWQLATEREVGLILMGFPLHMSGHEGKQTDYTREFATKLGERTGLPIRFWDERLTTVAANRVLRDSGISIAKRAKAVDQLSAQILLESFLDAGNDAESLS